MALNFADIASKKLVDIERPPLPPVGTYRFSVKQLPTINEIESPKGSWDVVEFQCRALEALDDVDMEGYSGEVTGIQMRLGFMFDKNDDVKFQQTEYNLRRFLEEHVACAEDGDSLHEAINKSVNGQFLGTVKWAPDKNDPDLFHANIGRTAPVE